MKKIYIILMSCILTCCVGFLGKEKGNIYGVVTDSSSAEPMRAAGVSLFTSSDGDWYLLLQTVTFDDGHFEFYDIEPGYYVLKIKMDGYETTNYNLAVESGRTARADIQMSKVDPGLTVITAAYTNTNASNYKFEGIVEYSFYPKEYGFVVGRSANPTLDNGSVYKATGYSKSGSRITFSAVARGEAYKGYHFRAYAIDKKYGIVVYGEDKKIYD